MVKDIAVDISPTQESNSKSFCIDEVGVKTLPGKIITDLDPSKRMNFASSVIRKSTKFIYFGLLTFNATSKQKSVLTPSTISEILNSTGGGSLNGDCLKPSHGAEVATERVSETKAYSNPIKI